MSYGFNNDKSKFPLGAASDLPDPTKTPMKIIGELQNQIIDSASIENGATASKAYASGDYICFQGALCKASKAISQGDTLSIGDSANDNLTLTDAAAEFARINSNLTINTEKTISLTTSQYESIEPNNNFTPNKSGIYRIVLYYHNDEPLELRVGTSSDYRNSEYIVDQPSGNLGTLNLICFLNAGVTYSIGTKYFNGGVVDNNAGFIQRLITIS